MIGLESDKNTSWGSTKILKMCTLHLGNRQLTTSSWWIGVPRCVEKGTTAQEVMGGWKAKYWKIQVCLWSVSCNSLLLECGFENIFPFSCKIWGDDRHHPLRTIGNVPFLLTQCGISHQWRTKWIRFQPTAPNEYWSKRNVKQQTFLMQNISPQKYFRIA